MKRHQTSDHHIYTLEAVSDDGRYEGFAAERASLLGNFSWEEDFTPLGEGIDRKKPRLTGAWCPLKVSGNVRAWNDFPCINLIIPAFSQRAVMALRQFLEPNGELLPLDTHIGEYYAYNVTTIADVLDRNSSEIVWMSDDPGPWDVRALQVKRFHFRDEALDQLSVFLIPELASGPIFVTHTFIEAAKSAGLRGMELSRSGHPWLTGNRR